MGSGGRAYPECGWGSVSVRIAAAHHSKDQAETILHNLLRGSGLRGLRGMPWTRGRIIRPLLGADRGDILAWLNAKGYSWVEDSTNNSEDYTRNGFAITFFRKLNGK